MAWSFNNREAIFLQIADKLRVKITSGEYAPDSQIPSVRQLAEEASVNPNTVQRSLALLEEEGLLYAKTTVGRFVTSDMDRIAKAREEMRRIAVKRLIGEAAELGISGKELIDYIKEEIEV